MIIPTNYNDIHSSYLIILTVVSSLYSQYSGLKSTITYKKKHAKILIAVAVVFGGLSIFLTIKQQRKSTEDQNNLNSQISILKGKNDQLSTQLDDRVHGIIGKLNNATESLKDSLRIAQSTIKNTIESKKWH